MLKMLEMAAKIALPSNEEDKRSFWLGAIGIRNDGALVSAKNGAVKDSIATGNWQTMPYSHAEGRLVRKLGKNGIVYVSRVAKKDGCLAMARPCPTCQTLLKSAKIRKVFYSINSNQYGIWYPSKDLDVVFDF